MLIKISKAQSTLEYALLIGVVVGGLLTMQNYLKRSIQGKLQATADEISPNQYSPYNTQIDDTLHSNIAKIEETTTRGYATAVSAGTGRTTVDVTGGRQESSSDRKIKSLEKEKWPGK